MGTLDSSFWKLSLTTIDGERIETEDLRGRPVLLSFWGEWCGPCIRELPGIASAYAKRKGSDFVLLGMLRTLDMEAAREAMSVHEITWPQVEVTDELKDLFRVDGYPRNILILSDGASYILAGGIGEGFFDRYVPLPR